MLREAYDEFMNQSGAELRECIDRLYGSTSTMPSSITIIMDNGGGIVLQIAQGRTRYQHYYDRPRRAARDLIMAMAGSRISDWDGNEADHGWLQPTADEIANGGCRIYTPLELLTTPVEDVFGAAGRQMAEALDPCYTNAMD